MLWNFSTTVRNPERVYDFLTVCTSINGMQWNHDTQNLFQIRLIQNGLYIPKNINANDYIFPITQEEAADIFYNTEYSIADTSIRGRTSFSLLRKLNYATIVNGVVQITQSGFDFLNGFNNFEAAVINYTFEEVEYGFKPIVYLIQIINEIDNYYENNYGISFDEFAWHCMTMNSSQELNNRVVDIINGRINGIDYDAIRNNCPNIENMDDYFDNNLKYIRQLECFIITNSTIRLNYNYIGNIDMFLNNIVQ